MVDIKCEGTITDVHKLIPHPKNPNTHSEDQIERLSKIIDFQGQRSPIVVSNQSGFIIAGHGRLQAMQKLGWDQVAVNYQDFESEAMEYAHLTADNAIGEWSSLDLSVINEELAELGPDLDIEMLGIENFEIEPLDRLPEKDEIPGDVEFSKEINMKNDYIVLLFSTKEDLALAKEKLGIKQIKLNLSKNGNKNLEITGTGRVIEGMDVINRL